MLLTIDIGNTMTDFGLFDTGEERSFYRIRSNRDLTFEQGRAAILLKFKSESLDMKSIDGIILSSVVPSLTETYRALAKALFHLDAKLLGPGLKTGLKVVTDNPKEVGADMIAAAVGAKSRYGNSCLIADCGTATKIILLDSQGAFAGCTIGAGIGLQAESLSSSAALLPEVSVQIPPKILGKNTADCMNSALTYGNAFGLSALADALEKEAGYPCKRILTGGFSSFIAPLLPSFSYEPHLVLRGLYDIYARNQ